MSPVYRPIRYVPNCCSDYGKAGDETCNQIRQKADTWKKRAAFKFPKALMYPQRNKRYAYWAERVKNECGGSFLPASTDTGLPLYEEENLAAEDTSGSLLPVAVVGVGALAFLTAVVVVAKKKKLI